MKKLTSISVVDDDEICRYLMQELIRDIECTQSLMQFKDGLDALNYLVKHHDEPDKLPDLILLDLEMPQMDGWQFLEEFVPEHFSKEIAIFIISSSLNFNDYHVSKTYLPVKGYLVKPVTKEQLLETVSYFQDQKEYIL